MENKQHIIRFHQVGGPEVLKFEELPLTAPKENEIQILHKAIGVNFVDTYYRSGLYPTTLPSGTGSEAAGVVEAVGSNVKHFKVGDRVAYAQGPLGAYADRRNVPANVVVKIPDNVSFESAAAVMLKGLTVYYLFKDIFPLKKEDEILFHAAAGGVGLIACQWAKHIGAKLIGTVSSDEKNKIAREHGAWEIINYKTENLPERILEITKGAKVPVVFDGVGKSTWEWSLDCLRPRGLMVSFGNASGPVTGINLATLTQKGSLFVTRPSLGHYMDTPEKLQKASDELFDLVGKGIIKTDEIKTFKLSEAAQAHNELNDRSRVGSLLLIP